MTLALRATSEARKAAASSGPPGTRLDVGNHLGSVLRRKIDVADQDQRRDAGQRDASRSRFSALGGYSALEVDGLA